MEIDVTKTDDNFPLVVFFPSEQRVLSIQIHSFILCTICLLSLTLYFNGVSGVQVLLLYILLFCGWIGLDVLAMWTSRRYKQELFLEANGDEILFVDSDGDAEIPEHNLKAFSLSSDEEWTETATTKKRKSERRRRSNRVNHWLLLVERKNGAPSIIARHNGSKAEMVELHDILTREFIYNRQFVE